jgi:hypothetical protein
VLDLPRPQISKPGLCFSQNLVVILVGQLRCLELERALRIIVESVVNVNSTVVVVVLPAAVSASSMSTAPSSLVGENRERTAEFPGLFLAKLAGREVAAAAPPLQLLRGAGGISREKARLPAPISVVGLFFPARGPLSRAGYAGLYTGAGPVGEEVEPNPLETGGWAMAERGGVRRPGCGTTGWRG